MVKTTDNTEEIKPSLEKPIKETARTVETLWSDVDTLGDTIDRIENGMQSLANNFEQFKKEVKKERKEQEIFNSKINDLISNETRKQIEPLVEQLNTLTRKKPKFIYVSARYPFVETIKKLFNKGR